MECPVTDGRLAPTHDLIRLREPNVLTVNAPMPAWVEPALRLAPWVVVRRGYVRDGVMPVGVRGPARQQRYAAFLEVAKIEKRLSPEDMTALHYAMYRIRGDAVPALGALARIAPILERRGHRWGPGGSVGFELATGLSTATVSSDLDVILRRDRQLERNEAFDLQAALAEAAAPARIDVIVETPCGGVSLADLALMPAYLLLRTPDGARLAADPWMMDTHPLWDGV